MQNTALSLLVLAVLMIIGILLSKIGRDSNSGSWKDEVLNTQLHGEMFLRFILGTIILVGAALKLGYLTYGLAGLPIFLIKGTKSLEDENDSI
jgi:hypothetical protein